MRPLLRAPQAGVGRRGGRRRARGRLAKMAPVEHVVADAGAFLRDAALQVQGAQVEGSRVWAGGPRGSDELGRFSMQDIGKNIYTVRDVVSEIRDKATRRRLAVLPYELRFKEPFPEYVRLGECLRPGVRGEAGRGADGAGSAARWGRAPG